MVVVDRVNSLSWGRESERKGGYESPGWSRPLPAAFKGAPSVTGYKKFFDTVAVVCRHLQWLACMQVGGSCFACCRDPPMEITLLFASAEDLSPMSTTTHATFQHVSIRACRLS